MKVVFTEKAWQEFTHWKENDRSKVLKIKKLLKSIQENPFKGIGKPEPLRHELRGYWSRRISHEDRLVYEIRGNREEQVCTIIQCRFHYR